MRGEPRKSQRTEIGVYAITRDNPRTISSVNFNNYGPRYIPLIAKTYTLEQRVDVRYFFSKFSRRRVRFNDYEFAL